MLGTGLGLAALARPPLYEVQAISYAAPMMVVVRAVLIAGERMRIVRIAAVLIVLGPRLDGAEASPAATMGALMALGGAFCAAPAQVFICETTETEEMAAIVLWFSMTATTVSLATIPFGWMVPSGGTAAMLVPAGLLGDVGQIRLTAAHRYADAGVVAPLSYASMPVALLIGLVVFAEVPRPSALGGAAPIIAGGALVARRERRLGLQRARAQAATTLPPG